MHRSIKCNIVIMCRKRVSLTAKHIQQPSFSNCTKAAFSVARASTLHSVYYLLLGLHSVVGSVIFSG